MTERLFLKVESIVDRIDVYIRDRRICFKDFLARCIILQVCEDDRYHNPGALNNRFPVVYLRIMYHPIVPIAYTSYIQQRCEILFDSCPMR